MLRSGILLLIDYYGILGYSNNGIGYFLLLPIN